jgi:hypothetical protein
MPLVTRLAHLGLGLLTLSALYAGYAFHTGEEAARAWITPLCLFTASTAILVGHWHETKRGLKLD